MDERYIWQGVKKAQEIACQEGLKVGRRVAHPSDRKTYELKEIKGGIAIVWLKQRGTNKEFPLNELFDPNVAMAEAQKKAFQSNEVILISR